MEQSKKKLSGLLINTYGLGDFGFQMMVNLEIMYFSFFLTDYVKFAPVVAGIIMTITSIFDIAWVPTAGVVVERSHMRWGKYRSWLLIGPPIIYVLYLLQFSSIAGPTLATAIVIAFGFIASHLVWNCTYTSHISLVSSLTDDVKERTMLSSRRMVFQAAGKILFSYIALNMIKSIGAVTSPTTGFTITNAIITLTMIAGYLVVFFTTKGYDKAEQKKENKPVVKKTPVWTLIKNGLANSQLVVLMLTDLGRCFAFYLVTGMTIYYFKVVIGSAAQASIYFVLINVAAFLGALLAPYVAKAVGKKTTYLLGMTVYAVCLLLVFLLNPSAILFMVIMIFASLCLQFSFSMGTAMFADTVTYGEWKTGVNARGFIMGLYSMPIKVSIFIRSAVMGAGLAAIAYSADAAITPTLVTGIRNLLTIYPAIALIVCVIFGALLYKLTDKKIVELTKEVNARKAA